VYSLSGASQILGIRDSLSAYAATGGSFTYGNTSSLNFILPSNVSFTSASGTFLSANVGPGGVPEPASWALMIAGFGLTGAAMRRRTKVVVTYA
jgi:PEP-CTERM motif